MALVELRAAVRDYAYACESGMDDAANYAATEVTRIVRVMLEEEPTDVQALALARLIRDRGMGDRHVSSVRVQVHGPDSFVLANFWEVTFPEDGFTCGIAPDGAVSS